jgi:hypothetical protein
VIGGARSTPIPKLKYVQILDPDAEPKPAEPQRRNGLKEILQERKSKVSASENSKAQNSNH